MKTNDEEVGSGLLSKLDVAFRPFFNFSLPPWCDLMLFQVETSGWLPVVTNDFSFLDLSLVDIFSLLLKRRWYLPEMISS